MQPFPSVVGYLYELPIYLHHHQSKYYPRVPQALLHPARCRYLIHTPVLKCLARPAAKRRI